jgi:uncharacterized protein
MRWALPALALIAACAGASDKDKNAAAAPHPALWKLSDADTNIYLFGTIHVLPDNYKWRTPAFDKAAGASQELVLEVADLDDDAKSADAFMRLATSPNLPPIIDRVPADKRAGLQSLVAKAGVPSPVLDRFESWAVAVTLSAGMLKALNVSPESGVERQLLANFRAAKKPVVGLETIEQQLTLFDTLAEPTQRAFLISMVDESGDARAEYEKMLTAWSSGNQGGIAISFDDELALTPELTDALLRKRNANWTAWIAERMKQPGTIMIAVGAGHLAGSESVQAMLAERGLKVSRLQ